MNRTRVELKYEEATRADIQLKQFESHQSGIEILLFNKSNVAASSLNRTRVELKSVLPRSFEGNL